MATDGFELPFLSNIGLMVTYKCPVACPHCIVEAGPHRTQEMRLDQALAWIDQARSYQDGFIQALCLTGGEPFYNPTLLTQISQYGRALGFIVSVVTNAFWAPSREAALHTLALAPAIQAMTISTDVYHQQAIPFEYVRNAVEAARELRRVYTIAVCTDSDQDPAHLKVVQQLAAMGEGDNIRVAITLPIGRARHEAHALHYSISSEPPVTACPVASSPVIFPNGDVIACIGPLLTLPPVHPLFLGNVGREPLYGDPGPSRGEPDAARYPGVGPAQTGSPAEREWIRRAPAARIYLQRRLRCLLQAAVGRADRRRLAGDLRDEELTRTVAYGRVYYLKEMAMAEQLHLGALAE